MTMTIESSLTFRVPCSVFRAPQKLGKWQPRQRLIQRWPKGGWNLVCHFRLPRRVVAGYVKKLPVFRNQLSSYNGAFFTKSPAPCGSQFVAQQPELGLIEAIKSEGF